MRNRISLEDLGSVGCPSYRLAGSRRSLAGSVRFFVQSLIPMALLLNIPPALRSLSFSGSPLLMREYFYIPGSSGYKSVAAPTPPTPPPPHRRSQRPTLPSPNAADLERSSSLLTDHRRYTPWKDCFNFSNTILEYITARFSLPLLASTDSSQD